MYTTPDDKIEKIGNALVDLSQSEFEALTSYLDYFFPEEIKIEKQMLTEIECWDHCPECGQSQGRFWVRSKEQFDREKAEVIGHKCMFCGGGKLVSYSEDESLNTPLQ